MTARVPSLTLLLLLAMASALGGCAADVVMLNPRTGATATCAASALGLNPWSEQQSCIGEHIAAGWVRSDRP